jgi:chromosome partitioning protein
MPAGRVSIRKEFRLACKKYLLPANVLPRYGRSMNIVFANTKGGVGKSTLAVHLAVWLHDQGMKVALLDTDKQCSSSQWIAEAEPLVTVRKAATPEECLSEVRKLAGSHDFIVGDGPGGLDDVSRTLLIVADLALLPISPSILDLRSVQQATGILRYAQEINGGRPTGRLVLNKMRTRDTISRELRLAAPELGVDVAANVIRDLQAYRDAAQQGKVVTRMIRKARHAADEMETLFAELLPDISGKRTKNSLNKEAING